MKPTIQERQAIDTDGDGTISSEELNAYLERVARQYAEAILLNIDGAQVALDLSSRKISMPAGAGGLPTLRVESDFTAATASNRFGQAHRLRFENGIHRDRIGWREIVVKPDAGVSVFDSSAFGSSISDELRAYPEDLLAAPLDERVAELSFTKGALPAGAKALMSRDGRATVQSRDRLAELIAVEEVTPTIVLLGLLIAAALGSLHALSPGHGKTVVGAYLVGSRGTARHAAFLGLTVTITHTIGVFALGLVTLFASNTIVPERLFPVLSLTSGAIVLAVGLSLLIRRLRPALASSEYHHANAPDDHTHHHHDHSGHDHDGSLTHSHGGRVHTHLPPARVTWRSLLALGISGGLLPCPSALVVLLSAISLDRVGYGLILVVAFSIGLASTLTAVGLLFVYAGRLMKRPTRMGRLVRVLPVVSAFVITCIGAVICYEGLEQVGIDLSASFAGLVSEAAPRQGTLSTAAALILGLVWGLKHAVEADHIAAISAIVSERKSLLSSSLVGGLWGIGHTLSLLVAGVAVLLLHVEISEKMALALEFCVAIMLIWLGVKATCKLIKGETMHIHRHHHGDHTHLHLHTHDGTPEPDDHTHHGLRLNARPLLVGMMHGLAGSGALMLLVLSTISSRLVGFIFIAVFGIGSIGGMILMSALVSLPIQFTANRFEGSNFAVRLLAGVFSIGFGLFLAYEIGFVNRLFG